MVERNLVLRTPGLVTAVKRRRELYTYFSRLLLAQKDPTCARCLFGRWLEYTHQRVARRAMLALSAIKQDQSLLSMCFDALRLSHHTSRDPRRGTHLLHFAHAGADHPHRLPLHF